MGWRFDFDNANLVAYLTSDRNVQAPKAEWRSVAQFTCSLMDHPESSNGLTGGDTVISTDHSWLQEIRDKARRCYESVLLSDNNKQHWNDFFVLDSALVEEILRPLRPLFSGYSLYALIVRTGSIYPTKDEEEFFLEIASSTQHRGLVLMPDGPVGLVNMLDPFPALLELARMPIDPPAVVFWTSSGSAAALTFNEAKRFFREVILGCLADGSQAVEAALNRRAAEVETKRFLHMSDLHFGDGNADQNRRYVKSEFAWLLNGIDRVIVTGDLFNSPEPALHGQFLEFKADIERMTTKDLIVIPGNHDMRPKGNLIPGMRQTYEFVVNIGWRPLSIDDDLECVFFCFNSMEESNFAKGCVSDAQLKRMASSFNEERDRRQRRRQNDIQKFTKIALVHHHPFTYATAATASYDRFLRRITGDEDTFTRFEEADEFVSWCAERGISLILHGHKHVPHHVEAVISVGNRTHSVMVVGCGSTTGVDGSPLSYDVIALNPNTGRWSVTFYEDASSRGAGFRVSELTLDTRNMRSSW